MNIQYYLKYKWNKDICFAIVNTNTYILNGKIVTIKELLNE